MQLLCLWTTCEFVPPKIFHWLRLSKRSDWPGLTQCVGLCVGNGIRCRSVRKLRNRLPRDAAPILVLALLVGACVVASEGPELPTCATTVTQEPTGDLAVDLVGAWMGSTDESQSHHPIAYMASTSAGGGGRRIWMFREDGTGHGWWSVSTEDRRFGNEEEFVWEVDDGQLVVNDLPPRRWIFKTPSI